jgi:hypothetical protein
MVLLTKARMAYDRCGWKEDGNEEKIASFVDTRCSCVSLPRLRVTDRVPPPERKWLAFDFPDPHERPL